MVQNHHLPTFGRAKDPPMSLKAGKDARLVTYYPFLFFSNFLVQNLWSRIAVRLLINYQHTGVIQWLEDVVWDHGAVGSNPATRTIIKRRQGNLIFFEKSDIIFIEKAQTANHLEASVLGTDTLHNVPCNIAE